MNSKIGQCGCLIGVYAAWGGESIAVIDLPNPWCTHHHRLGDVPAEPVSVSVTTTAERH